jgi:alpha-L-fucosidase
MREDRPAMGTPGRTEGRWWDHRRFGLLVQVSTASVPAWAPIGQYAEWYRAHLDGDVSDTLLHPSPMVETIAHHRDRWAHVEHYDDFVSFLTFDEFDPDAWAGVATDAGMSYTVMVAKHHDGLCWWDAPNTDRTVVALGPRRNVLGEYAAACKRAGIAFGTYYSLLDWSDPRYPSCEYVEQVVHPHVLDLVGRYGSQMLWGDGHWGGGGSHWRSDELIAAAREVNPDLLVNDRWWSDGPGVRSFEYRLPPDVVEAPWEMRRGLGGSFGYNRAERAEHLMSAHDVVALLTEVLAKGGHLLLAVGPDALGRIPDVQADALRTAGSWVQRHRELVDRSVPWKRWGDARTRYLVVDGTVHAIDIDGHGRFPALARTAGIVRSVVRLDRAGPTPVGFEQTDELLGIAHRGRFDPPVASDRVDVAVYRVDLEPLPPPPIELFPSVPPQRVELATVVAGARPGSIIQLGDGTYVGPARIPDGVVVRGLGPGRTIIDGLESHAVSVGREARLEHCTVRGGGPRIVWLPKVAAVLAGSGAVMLGCAIDGHIEIAADDCRVTSCSLTGVVAKAVDRVVVSRSTFAGMNWDCAVEIELGTGHVVDSCEFRDVLDAIRLNGTIGATVRGNRIHARWWGVRAVDTEGTLVVGNAVEHTMRAVDVDGGALAEVTGNAVADGDSGCVIQRGASDTTVAGNRWERCRTGLLAWDAGAVRYHDNTIVDIADPVGVTIGP